MSRIVRRGTEKKLYRLTPEDLPADHDLSESCWEYVDASRNFPQGLDLSGYNCEFMDNHFSNCDGVILPNDLTGVVSIGSTWAGAQIPSTLSFCSWSLMGEVLRRNTAPSGSRAAEMIEYVIGLVDNAHNDPRNPWMQAYWHFESQMGASPELVCATFDQYAFRGYPSLVKALYDNAAVYTSQPPPQQDHDLIVQRPGTWQTYSVPASTAQAVGLDRYLAARRIEQYLEQLDGQGGWQAKVFFLKPVVYATAGHESYLPQDWWRRLWPH